MMNFIHLIFLFLSIVLIPVDSKDVDSNVCNCEKLHIAGRVANGTTANPKDLQYIVLLFSRIERTFF